MKLSAKKKAILLITSYLVILLTPKLTREKKDTITYNDEFNIRYNHLYATYNDRDIYIGHKYYIEMMDKNNKDIYIIDERASKNPDLSVCNSYKYRLKMIKEITKILMEYEEKYPSKWDRTYESLIREWIIHNICYFLNLETTRTEQVDLDNSDEAFYADYKQIIDEIITKFEEKYLTPKEKALTK